MHKYLVGQGNWSYVEGAHENQPNPTHPDHLTWDQVASLVLYYLASCVHDHMLGYIKETKMPKEAWGGPQQNIGTNTTARKLQLRQELNNIQ